MEDPLYGLIVVDESRNKRPLPLKEVKVDTYIRDTLAVVDISQHYDGAAMASAKLANVTVVYTFPLWSSGVVGDFTVTVDDVVFRGDVKGKAKAREEYEEAVDIGHGGYLLEQERDDIFTCSLGNLELKTKVTVNIKYHHCLEAINSSGVFRYTLPRSIAPRYSPKEEAGDSVPLSYSCLGSMADMKFKCYVDMPGGKIEAIECHAHSVKVAIKGVSKAEVTMPNSSSVYEDVVLVIETKDLKHHVMTTKLEQSMLGIKEPASKDALSVRYNCAAMLSFLPQFTLDSEGLRGTAISGGIGSEGAGVSPKGKEYWFIVDRSGSMSGDRMKQSRNALIILIKSLSMEDKFNLVGFGSRHELWKEECVIYSEETVFEACKYVSKLEADLGGTEILEPLKVVFGTKMQASSKERIIMVLTDGQVTNEAAVIGLVGSQYRKGAGRTFSLGIGDGVSNYLVKGMASAGHGVAHFVTDKEDIRESVSGLLKKSQQPRIDNLTVKWNSPKYEESDVLEDREPPKVLPAVETKSAPPSSSSFFDPAQAQTREECLAGVPDATVPDPPIDPEALAALEDGYKRVRMYVAAEDVYCRYLAAPLTPPPMYSGNLFTCFLLFNSENRPDSVTITGDGPNGSKLSLTVPVPAEDFVMDGVHSDASPEAAFANNAFLHKMACREVLRVLAELEASVASNLPYSKKEGNPTLKNVENLAIAIGSEFKVVSKWTSFIIIEHRDKQKSGQTPKTIISIPQARPPIFHAPRMMMCCAAAPMFSKRCATPAVMPFGMPPPAPGLLMADYSSDLTVEDNSGKDFIQKVAELQKFNGAFSCDQKLLAALEIEMTVVDDLSKQLSCNVDVIVSAFVLRKLGKFWSEKAVIWGMMADKTVAWLEQQVEEHKLKSLYTKIDFLLVS